MTGDDRGDADFRLPLDLAPRGRVWSITCRSNQAGSSNPNGKAFAAGRRFPGQLADAALGRMQPHLQCIERQTCALWYRELAVEDETARRQSAHQLDHLREIAAERFSRFCPQLHPVTQREKSAGNESFTPRSEACDRDCAVSQ
jgi:hypothetical protein